MALSIGIVGLPNVGKSTLFNALTKAQNAQSANYPFCTIEPNKATVPVPDKRLNALQSMVSPQKVIQATVDFIDIAGLVRGASKGEGLGNKFLANIRETAAILHVVRCFDNDDITHVDNSIDPIRDVETIETELLLADIQSLENRVERLRRQSKSGDKELRAILAECEGLLAHMNDGGTAASYEFKNPDLMVVPMRELGLITAKKVIYCANVDEDGLMSLAEADDSVDYVNRLQAYANERGADTVVVCAKVEEDLQALSEEEQLEFLESYGLEESGLERVIHTGYHTLGLISYFTAGVKEVRAWTIEQGWKAPKAASVIHTDFEKGFIRAETIGYDDFVAHKSEAACRTAGVLRVEGKEYVVKDGDVMHFLFNV